MEVIVGDFGIVVVPRDGADTEKILNHSSILRKYKVLRREPRCPLDPPPFFGLHMLNFYWEQMCAISALLLGEHSGGERRHQPPHGHRQLNQKQVSVTSNRHQLTPKGTDTHGSQDGHQGLAASS